MRVVGAGLRTATAVGRWVAAQPGPVAVIASGEQWPDGSLRPAVEDLWGAGAVLAAAGASGSVSPEAASAEAAWRAVSTEVRAGLLASASGQELVSSGFAEDVEIAAEVDSSLLVPVLDREIFRAG